MLREGAAGRDRELLPFNPPDLLPPQLAPGTSATSLWSQTAQGVSLSTLPPEPSILSVGHPSREMGTESGNPVHQPRLTCSSLGERGGVGFQEAFWERVLRHLIVTKWCLPLLHILGYLLPHNLKSECGGGHDSCVPGTFPHEHRLTGLEVILPIVRDHISNHLVLLLIFIYHLSSVSL